MLNDPEAHTALWHMTGLTEIAEALPAVLSPIMETKVGLRILVCEFMDPLPSRFRIRDDTALVNGVTALMRLRGERVRGSDRLRKRATVGADERMARTLSRLKILTRFSGGFAGQRTRYTAQGFLADEDWPYLAMGRRLGSDSNGANR
jgi:hypothetical protein